ncbi:MAG: ABC transporter permease [Gammaproteobacteria bacterium]|jgi:ABC-2 type transport system permease protein|nr:ABC transporter permease [Gammaproteobacteria bacterium]|tara:strand:- start:6219 stop:7313 length:1095 start_codon:yes stop_codon:yes gene_type:complete
MKPARVITLIGKEGRELIRDPITLGLCAVMPLIMLFLFGYAVNLDVENVAMGVYDEDRTPASRDLTERFAATDYFDLRRTFGSLGELEKAMQQGEIRLALIVPRNFHRHLLEGAPAPTQILVDGSYPAIAALAGAYAEAIVSAFPRPRPSAIQPQVRVWYNPSMRSSHYIVPGLFAVILMAFPPLLTALAIVREKETGTISQIFASPATSAEFVAGKLVPYGVVAFFEIVMVVAIGTLWFDVPFRGSVLLFLAAAMIYVLTTVAIGLLVSAVTSTQLSAMLLALVVTLMPSFLFSGFLFPVFTMPLALQIYSQLFPATYFTEISRGIVLKGAGIDSLALPVSLLFLYTLVIFAIATRRLRQKVA